MAWLLMTLLTLVAFGIVQAVYALVQAFVGSAFGAGIEAISLGFGPVLIDRTIGGVSCRISAIPMGSYTKFVGSDSQTDQSESVGFESEKGAFEKLPRLSRLAVMLSGPVSSLVIGLICVSIPVAIGGDQVVVDSALPEVWKKNGVPHLTVAQYPSTWKGQETLFTSTALEFFMRIATLRSLSGWGGYIGWLSTMGSAGNDSPTVWLSCFGVTIFAIGVVNLLPIPTLNGFYILFLLIDPVFGKRAEAIRSTTSLIGAIAMLFLVFGRIILTDIMWILTVH